MNTSRGGPAGTWATATAGRSRPRDVRADPDQVQRPAAGTGWRRQRHGLVLQDPDAGVLQRLAEFVGAAAEGV